MKYMALSTTVECSSVSRDVQQVAFFNWGSQLRQAQCFVLSVFLDPDQRGVRQEFPYTNATSDLNKHMGTVKCPIQ